MAKVFVDSNIFIYSKDSRSAKFQEAAEILESIIKENHQGIISPFVVNELHYYYIKIYGFKKARILTGEILEIPRIAMSDILLDTRKIKGFFRLTEKFKLNSFDAFHAYYCKILRIKHIATFDSDFKRVKWLKIFKGSN